MPSLKLPAGARGERATAFSAALAAVAGLSTAMSVAGSFPSLRRAPVFLCCAATLACVLVIWAFLDRVVVPRIAAFRHGTPAAWSAGAFLLGLVLTFTIPAPLPSLALGANRCDLRIVATGTRSAAARASQVWVHALTLPDGAVVPLTEFANDGRWEQYVGHWGWTRPVLRSIGVQPAVLRWSGSLPDSATLAFLSYEYSGKVRVQANGWEREVDLYRPPDQGQAEVTLRIPVQPTAATLAARAAFRLAYAIWIGLLLFVCGALLAARLQPERTERSRHCFFYCALPCATAWAIYLLVYYPGLLSADSVDQWRQMQTAQYNDWHPVFHTMTKWLITRVWYSPAAIAAVQILCLAAVTGLHLSYLHKRGVQRWITALTCIAFALAPPNGLSMIDLGKDSLFSIALLAVMVLLLRITETDGLWLETKGASVLFGLLCALVILYRHNGILPIVGIFAAAAIAYRRRWRALARSVLVCACVCVAVRTALFWGASVNKSPYPPAWSYSMVYCLAGLLAADVQLRSDEVAVLDQVRPLAAGWPYSTRSGEPLFYDGHLNERWLRRHPREVARVFWSVAQREPFAVLEHLVDINAYVWRLRTPPEGEMLVSTLWCDPANAPVTMDRRLLPELAGFSVAPASVWPRLQCPLARVALLSGSYATWRWLIWRPSTALHVFCAAVVIAILRARKIQYAILLVPIALNVAGVSLLNCSQAFRYHYPEWMVAVLFSGYLLFGVPAHAPALDALSDTEQP